MAGLDDLFGQIMGMAGAMGGGGQTQAAQPAQHQGPDIGALVGSVLGMLAGGGNAPAAAAVPQQAAQPSGGMGGLGSLIDGFQKSGLGDVIGSWIGTGTNQAISPGQLGQALGPQQVNALANQHNVSPSFLLMALSSLLPFIIDKLTPDGKVDMGFLNSALSFMLGRLKN